MKLGQWGDILPAVTSIAESWNDPASSAAPPGGPTTVSPPITVSPAVQTGVSPMISPVFQQTQSSPGARQSAAPMQLMTSRQTAESSGPGAPQVPGSGPVPIPIPMGRDIGPGFPEAFPDPFTATPVFQDSDGSDYQTNQLIKWGVIGLLVYGGITMLGKPKRGNGGKTSSSKAMVKR